MSIASAVPQAYGMARVFIDAMETLVYAARNRPVERWRELGASYARAFIPWHDLSLHITWEIRDAARAAIGPNAQAILIGRSKAKHTVLEWVADELGVCIRNSVFFGRRTPFEPDWVQIYQRAPKPPMKGPPTQSDLLKHDKIRRDWIAKEVRSERLRIKKRLGIKTELDAMLIVVKEWDNQKVEAGMSAAESLRCGTVRLDEVAVRLDFEARAVQRSFPPAPLGGKGADFKAAGKGERPRLRVPFHFSEEHLTLLAELADRARRVTASELTGLSGMPCYDSIVDLLNEMENAVPPLVERPSGPRSGYVITESGRDELRKRDLLPPAT